MVKYRIAYTNRYKKQTKKLDKETIEEVENVIDRLANDEVLEKRYCDHALKGRLKGFRDCHVKPDLVLIYSKKEDTLLLTAFSVGTHSVVFG